MSTGYLLSFFASLLPLHFCKINHVVYHRYFSMVSNFLGIWAIISFFSIAQIAHLVCSDCGHCTNSPLFVCNSYMAAIPPNGASLQLEHDRALYVSLRYSHQGMWISLLFKLTMCQLPPSPLRLNACLFMCNE